MSKVNIFFTNGFEEVEALTVVDLLRRANIETTMVSVTGELMVTGSHGISVQMDKLFEDLDDDADMLVLPGGPGTKNLKQHDGLIAMIRRYDEAGKYLAAICAAPTVYGELGLLEGRMATCYPDMEDGLKGATPLLDSVVIDGRLITSRGVGTAISFSLALVGILTDAETAQSLAHKIVYDADFDI
ncbi:MAG: DJ-1/PfpI family protein [Eubacteriales bacterium]|nr:DJ-1/PfpI family protein [Eubacteriales bacterium]